MARSITKTHVQIFSTINEKYFPIGKASTSKIQIFLADPVVLYQRGLNRYYNGVLRKNGLVALRWKNVSRKFLVRKLTR